MEKTTMDPTTNLNQQMEICSRIVMGRIRGGDMERLADLVLDLNDWIRAGGFLPLSWQQDDR